MVNFFKCSTKNIFIFENIRIEIHENLRKIKNVDFNRKIVKVLKLFIGNLKTNTEVH